jgi:hypothetical protein
MIMAQSKIIIPIESLSDLLFGFKHSIRATNVQFDQNHETVHMTVEGDDVPDVPQIKLDFIAVYGRALDPKKIYKRKINNPVREVRLDRIYPSDPVLALQYASK